MYVKSPACSPAGWPLVLPDDDGIRPAGAPDACFYCGRMVGEEHARGCVCVVKAVAYDVIIDAGGGDRVVGAYTHYEPYTWTVEDGEFHKNGSSWCKSNALDSIEWTDANGPKAVAVWNADPAHACVCGLLTFRFRGVIDPGPLVERPDPE